MSSRSAGSRIETGLALFAVCCLALAAAEIGARLALALRSAVKPPSAPADGRASAAPYADAAYDAARLFREDGAADEQMYVPYVVWHRRPFAGELVNVDSRGERVTHFVSDAPGALRVWLLGGSTIWGMGAPDAETIPSRLARILNEEWRVPARVRNTTDYFRAELVRTLADGDASLLASWRPNRADDYVSDSSEHDGQGGRAGRWP